MAAVKDPKARLSFGQQLVCGAGADQIKLS